MVDSVVDETVKTDSGRFKVSSEEAVAAERAINDAAKLCFQLRGLKWTGGVIAALLVFAIGWGVSTIREQATHEGRITELENATKELQSDKEDHKEFMYRKNKNPFRNEKRTEGHVLG